METNGQHCGANVYNFSPINYDSVCFLPEENLCSFFIFPAAGWELIGLVGWNYFPPAFLTKRSWHFYASVINESLLVWMLDRTAFTLLVMSRQRNDLHGSNVKNADWFQLTWCHNGWLRSVTLSSLYKKEEE